MMNRKIGASLLALVFAPAIAAEAPAPFGLAIGGACSQTGSMETEVQGISAITGGPIFDVDTASIQFEGLRSVTVICSESGTIGALNAEFGKEFGGATFDRLKGMLEGEYSLDRLEEAHVGNQEADFSQGDVLIELREPHMSHTTSLIYMTRTFDLQYEQYLREKDKDKQERESGQL